MKRRGESARVGNQGITALMRFCDDAGFIFQGEPREDFGIDAWIEVADGDNVSNFIVGAQVKAGSSYKESEDTAGFRVRVSSRDVSYWLAANIPTFLFYFDTEYGRLYAVHLETYFEQHGRPEDSTSTAIFFDKVADICSEAKATYMLGLRKRTPSALERMEVLSANPVVIRLGQEEHALQPPASTETNSSAQLSYFQPANNDYGWAFPYQSTVLGFSADDVWVAELNVVGIGQKCSTLRFRALNLREWYAVDEWIYSERDYDDLGSLPESLLEERRAVVNQHLLRLNIQTPSFMWQRERDRRTLAWHNSACSIRFGKQTFSLMVRGQSGRSVLELENSAYVPPRRKSIIIENDAPGYMYHNADGYQSMTHPKGYRWLTGAWGSANETWLTFAMRTNSEHSCMGNEDLRFVHVSVAELRRLACESLRR